MACELLLASAAILARLTLVAAQDTPPINSFVSAAGSLASAVNSINSAEEATRTTSSTSIASTTPSSSASTSPSTPASSSATPSETAAAASGDDGTHTRNIIIIVCVVVGVVLLIIAALIACFCIRRRRRRRAVVPLHDREIDSWRQSNGPNHVSRAAHPPMQQQPTVPLMTAYDSRPISREHPAFRDQPNVNDQNPFTPMPPPQRKPLPDRRHSPSHGLTEKAAFGAAGAGVGAYAMHHHDKKGRGTEYAGHSDFEHGGQSAALIGSSGLPTKNHRNRPPTPLGLDFGPERPREHGHHMAEAAAVGGMVGATAGHHHHDHHNHGNHEYGARRSGGNYRNSDPFSSPTSDGYDDATIAAPAYSRRSGEHPQYGTVEPNSASSHDGRHTGIGSPYTDSQVAQFVHEPPSSELRRSLQERERRFSGHGPDAYDSAAPAVPSRSPHRSFDTKPPEPPFAPIHTDSASSAETYTSARDSMVPPPVPWDDSRRSSPGDRTRYSGDYKRHSRSPRHSANATPTGMHAPNVPWSEERKRWSGDSARRSYEPKVDGQGRPRRLRFSDVHDEDYDGTGVGQAL